MNVLRNFAVVSALVFAMFGSAQAKDVLLPEGLPDPEIEPLPLPASGDCHFDYGLPLDGDKLPKNTTVSLYGSDCSVFELWVGPYYDSLPRTCTDELGNSYDCVPKATNIPRSNIYIWHSCRFVNVLTEYKLNLYAYDWATPEDERVTFVGVCGSIDETGAFVPKGYDYRRWEVSPD